MPFGFYWNQWNFVNGFSVYRVTGVFLFVINLSQIANNNSNTENVYVFINQ